jgi:hypothetical protein
VTLLSWLSTKEVGAMHTHLLRVVTCHVLWGVQKFHTLPHLELQCFIHPKEYSIHLDEIFLLGGKYIFKIFLAIHKFTLIN